MPTQILPVTGLDQVGVIKDTPPSALPPQAFSDARNVRFRDGAALKMLGEVNIFPEVFDSDTLIKYVAWWPNPNLVVEQSGYYLLIAERLDTDTNSQRDHAYIVKPGGQPELKGTFQPDSRGAWQHTFFQGGFCLIINNGIDVPHYILDDEGNDDIDLVPDFKQLPGWDKYTVNQQILDDTFEDNSSHVFDLGQTVNFNVNLIQVDYYRNNAATNVPANGQDANSPGYVPPNLPASITIPDTGFNIYSDTETGTTVIVLPDDIVVGDRVTVRIRSINEAAIRCGVIRSFGDFLVAANIIEVEDTDNDVIIRALPGVVKTSDVAAPGSLPNNWDPFAAGVSTADEFTVTQEGVVQDLVELQGSLYIYSNSSISTMTNTGNPDVPLVVRPVTDSYGVQTTNGVIQFDGQHFVVGSQDIYIFGGHPGNIQSVSDGRVREYFFNRINPLHQQRMFVIRNRQVDEIWVCYPTKDSITGECDEALIWNYRKNNWTVRDLNGVVAGDFGPIPGGGIPTTSVHLAGSSGNSGIASLGAREIQTLLINPNISITGDDLIGRPTEYDVTVNSTIPAYTASGALIFDLDLTGFNSGISDPLYFYAQARDANQNLLFEYEHQLQPNLSTNTQVHDDLHADPLFEANMNAIAPSGTTELVIEFLDTDVAEAQVSFGLRRLFTQDSLVRDSEFDIVPDTDQTHSSTDTECVLNGAIYVDLDDVGNYYFLDINGYPTLPPGTTFEILSGIGNDSDEYLYDARTNDSEAMLNFMYGDVSQQDPGGHRGGRPARPYADGSHPPQFMFRYRAPSADSGRQESEPWIPQFNGLYQVRITVPRADSDTDCPQAGDWQLDAYMAPNRSTDGTPAVGVRDLSRTNAPFDSETIASAAPVLQFQVGRNAYNSMTDTEDQQTPANIFVALGGNFDTDTETRRREIAEHIAHEFHDVVGSLFNGNDSEFTAKLVSRNSGSYYINLVAVGGTTHGVTIDDFTVNRIVHGWWPRVQDLSSGSYGDDVIQIIYPTITASIASTNLPAEPSHSVAIPLTNPNGDPTLPITANQLIRQVDVPTRLEGWNNEIAALPRELTGVVQQTNGITWWTANTSHISTPAERRVPNNWAITTTTYGNIGLKEEGWNPGFDSARGQVGNDIHGVTITQQMDFRGQWQQRATPTYMALLVSNGSDPVLYPGGLELVLLEAGNAGLYDIAVDVQTGSNGVSLNNEQAAEKWISDIRLINPRLSTLDRGTDGQFIIQPANYSDASQFVLEVAINDTVEGTSLLNNWLIDGEARINPDNDTDVRVVTLNPNSVDVIRNYGQFSGELLQVEMASVAPTAVIDTDYTQFNAGTRVPNLTSMDSDASLRNSAVTGPDAKVFDVDRPWGTNEVNYNLQYPIFASYKIVGQDYRVNKVLAGDVGWSWPTYSNTPRADSFPGIGTNRVITGNDTPMPYRSYAKREEMPITPEFTTETVSGIAMLADGFYKPGYFDSDSYNRLIMNAYGTNYPGERFETGDRQISNVFYITEDYKLDLRTEGRFINIEVGDAPAPNDPNVTPAVDYRNKTFTQQANWRVNGLQLEIMSGGRR